MNEKPPQKKFTLETIPNNIVNDVYKCLNDIASGLATDKDMNWLIDNIEPQTIKDLSRLNAHFSEMNTLEEIIKKKSLPPTYFD